MVQLTDIQEQGVVVVYVAHETERFVRGAFNDGVYSPPHGTRSARRPNPVYSRVECQPAVYASRPGGAGADRAPTRHPTKVPRRQTVMVLSRLRR